MKKVLALLLIVLLGVSLAGFAKGKVAVVLDVGGRGDLSFNDMGFKGTDQAAKDFGYDMVEIQCATAADYLPNLRNVARTGDFELIICVGFLLGDALGTAAAEFPEQKFAIIDVGWITGPNIMNIVFRENEMSALVGALGAMAAAEYGYDYVGIVLGIEIPVLYHFEAGYRFGIDWGIKKYAEVKGTTPDVGLLYTYTGTFSDIALGKAASEAMLSQGAVAIYNVAGPLGIGDLEAVTEFHDNAGTTFGPPYFFGVDANQDYLGNGLHALASGMKRVDVACYDAVKAVAEGTFEPGVVSLGLAEGGVAISKIGDLADFIQFGIDGGAVETDDFYTIIGNWAQNRASIPAWIWDAVAELEAGVLDGTVVVPTADTGDEMAAVRAEFTLGAP
ncbi:MAG: BMP family ABC transporter substrate-binding protein [Candidatus Bipolaricaulota bacterium]|nr:BMP family ABC transporter substrate-binding protein [Candidatus Bipolaricaulota bacterium]